MKHARNLCVAPGEIWAVTASDSALSSELGARLARAFDGADGVAILNFAQQSEAAQKTGWPQARYYETEGETVEEFLSFNSTYDVIPFEVGARYPETRKAYKRRINCIMRLLNLRKFAKHQVISLSNGETRRLLLASALAKRPKVLVLDDPAAGLDSRQRAKLRDIVAALAKRGLHVIFAYRHVDELPQGVARWLKMDSRGDFRVSNSAFKLQTRSPESGTRNWKQETGNRRRGRPSASKAQPVVEISNLNLKLGGRQLFKGFSWTVRKGERWILHGENGSGKTTLFALITGDSPFAYAADMKVFGIPRDTGTELARVRRRIGIVSPEMQAYLGENPEALLDRALDRRHDLLLLDEPFMNLSANDARRLGRRIAAYLRAHRDVTAILICHRRDEAPPCFDRELGLDEVLPAATRQD